MKKLFIILLILTAQQSYASIDQTYSFIYNDTVYDMKLTFPNSALNCYQYTTTWQNATGTKSRYAKVGISKYVTGPCSDQYVQSLIPFLNQYMGQAGVYTRNELINFLIAFVNGIPYRSDEVLWKTSDYYQTAFQTLYLNGGDCEDHAILLAALFRNYCFRSVLITIPGHMAVGISENNIDPIICTDYNPTYTTLNNEKFYYCEATSGDDTTWKVGESKKKGTTIENVTFVGPSC